MHQKIKIILCFFFFFTIITLFFSSTFAKYVIEDIFTIAKLDIDRCKPNIELIDITSSNHHYTNYANKTHTITGHIKITENHIVKNNMATSSIKVFVNNIFITPNFTKFFLVSQNATQKIYEFSFTHTTGDGALTLMIPEGIIEDKSGLVNDTKYFSTGIIIDNTPPNATFQEVVSSNHKSKAQITCNEAIRPLVGWEISSNSMILSKEFSSYITYPLPITDFAENSSNVTIDIKNATNMILEYGTYDNFSNQTLVSGGKISSPATISSNSICKTESIFIRLTGDLTLQTRAYVHTYWGDGARMICPYSELSSYHGYNPISTSEWITVGSQQALFYQGNIYTQLGRYGLNSKNANASNIKNPIPSAIASQYLYGISGLQFKLKNSSEFCVVYQSYVKDVGWLAVSCDGEENFYQHDKPICAFRINIVPKTEKQFFIDFWMRDVTSYSHQ